MTTSMSATGQHERPALTTLILIAAAAPLSMNVFVPALPAMAADLGVDHRTIQSVISVYLLATGVFQLLAGPASDRFGRRPLTILSLSIFLAASIGAALATSIEAMMLCRVMQAFSAAGIVLSRAIVRDTSTSEEATARIGYITMGVTVIPMISPMLGGLISQTLGWRALFGVIAGFGAVALLFAVTRLDETHHRRAVSLAAQFATYPRLLRKRLFWAFALTAALNHSCWFAFMGGSVYIASGVFELTPMQYGAMWGFSPAGYILGNFVTVRLARRTSLTRIMLLGNFVILCGMGATLLTLGVGLVHPLVFFASAVFIGISNGMILPASAVGSMNIFPDLAGSAVGICGAFQLASGALMSFAAGFLVGPTLGAVPIIAFIVMLSVASAACSWWSVRLSKPG